MEVEYGLVTSSALPDKIRDSENFLEVDASQWFDLVEYSKKLEPLKESEKVMVLCVAHGTPEQEARERERECQRTLKKGPAQTGAPRGVSDGVTAQADATACGSTGRGARRSGLQKPSSGKSRPPTTSAKSSTQKGGLPRLRDCLTSSPPICGPVAEH